MNDSQKLAQLKASVSMAVSYARAIENKSEEATLRMELEKAILGTIARTGEDSTCWTALPPSSRTYYDDYLQDREHNMTVTDYDYVRTGLVAGLFSTPAAWADHCQRMGKATPAREKDDGVTKHCAYCNQYKPLSSFPRKGGGRCSSCKSKAYRANLKARGQ